MPIHYDSYGERSMDPTTAAHDEPPTGAERPQGDDGLDWYDRLLAQTFPASDPLPLWEFDP